MEVKRGKRWERFEGEKVGGSAEVNSFSPELVKFCL